MVRGCNSVPMPRARVAAFWRPGSEWRHVPRARVAAFECPGSERRHALGTGMIMPVYTACLAGGPRSRPHG